MKRMRIALATAFVVGASASGAQAADVVNGGFETGDFSGWTVANTANGNWFTYDSSNLVPPSSGAAIHSTIAAPPEGTHAAVTDMISPGNHILYQDVALDSVAPGDKLTLSLYVYYKAQQNNQFLDPNPDSLSQSASGGNQQFRVEVMKPSAAVNSVDPADVLATVFRTKAGDPLTLAPEKVTADLTQFAGQTIRIRAAEVDSQGIVNGSIDGVEVVTEKKLPTIQFSPPTRNPKNGTATLPAAVNGAGSVVISGDGIATQTVQSSGAGTVQLPVTPTGSLKKQIKKDRKGKANITATFTDSATGRTVTDVRRVHLRHKRK